MKPDCGECNCDPDRAGRLNKPGGETRLDVEYLLGRENMEGNPEEVSRYSGGVVGSDWCPVKPRPVFPRPKSSCICANSSSSISCCCSSLAISASNRRFCSTNFSYSSVFFCNCSQCQQDEPRSHSSHAPMVRASRAYIWAPVHVAFPMLDLWIFSYQLGLVLLL
jgi:hypothetical protein